MPPQHLRNLRDGFSHPCDLVVRVEGYTAFCRSHRHTPQGMGEDRQIVPPIPINSLSDADIPGYDRPGCWPSSRLTSVCHDLTTPAFGRRRAHTRQFLSSSHWRTSACLLPCPNPIHPQYRDPGLETAWRLAWNAGRPECTNHRQEAAMQ